MSTVVRKATQVDAPAVYELLRTSTLANKGLSYAARERAFQPVWGGDEGHYGYVLQAADQVVGFLGTLFTERFVNEQPQKFCELHSWYVREEHRRDSIKLFLSAMSTKRVTFLNYTPSSTVYEIGKSFGFQDLETDLLRIYPVPSMPRARRWTTVTTDKAAILAELDGIDRHICQDHYDLDCEHILLTRDDDEYLYVILKKMWWRRFEPFGRILYFSDETAFADVLRQSTMSWCLRFGMHYLMIDRQLLSDPGDIPFTTTRARSVPSQFKSKSLTSEDLRVPLYNEPVLLGYRLH